MSAFIMIVLGWWQRLTCGHHWLRARWDDGSYGFRCAHCMKPYRHTWNEIFSQPVPRTSLLYRGQPAVGQPAKVPSLHRAA